MRSSHTTITQKASQAKSIRLGYGELSDERMEASFIRVFFLCTLDSLPETMDCRRELYALWHTHRHQIANLAELWMPRITVAVSDELTEWWASKWPVDPPLRAWATRWGLTDAKGEVPVWMRDVVTDTLRKWSTMTQWRQPGEPWEWSYPGAGMGIPDEPERRDYDPYWSPNTAREVKKDRKKAFREHVDDFIAREIAQHADTARPRYKAGRLRDPKQIERYVRHQCLGKPISVVADRNSVQTVMNQFAALRRVLQFARRGGRPRTSNTE